MKGVINRWSSASNSARRRRKRGSLGDFETKKGTTRKTWAFTCSLHNGFLTSSGFDSLLLVSLPSIRVTGSARRFYYWRLSAPIYFVHASPDRVDLKQWGPHQNSKIHHFELTQTGNYSYWGYVQISSSSLGTSHNRWQKMRTIKAKFRGREEHSFHLRSITIKAACRERKIITALKDESVHSTVNEPALHWY